MSFYPNYILDYSELKQQVFNPEFLNFLLSPPYRNNETMQRFAFKMKLKPGYVTEYQQRHQAIWPEIVQLLKEAGISDYSIFLDEETNTLFAVQKQAGQSSQDLGANPIVQKWWAYMADIMDTNPDNSPVAVPLREVFWLA